MFTCSLRCAPRILAVIPALIALLAIVGCCPETEDCDQRLRPATTSSAQGFAGVQLGVNDSCTACCGCAIADNGVTVTRATAPVTDTAALCALVDTNPERIALDAGHYTLTADPGDWVVCGGGDCFAAVVEAGGVTTLNFLGGEGLGVDAFDPRGERLQPHFFEESCP